jgi:small subunit ribosomal protein S17e
MGRVRVDLVKRSARHIIEKYFTRLTLDFDTNKKICDEVAQIPTKRLRNKIAGYITHLMKRIERGPVRGISLKLQEEERERRMDFVPEQSVLDMETIEIDADTMEMLKSIDLPDIRGVNIVAPQQGYVPQQRDNQGQRGDRKNRPPRRERTERKREAPATAAAAAAAPAADA